LVVLAASGAGVADAQSNLLALAVDN